jgi:ApbE superfamily uncharacterized protein (UPF0280 family)
MHQARTYRNLIDIPKLYSYSVVVKETDLLVFAEKKLERETRELVLEQRGYLEAFIETHPGFAETLAPWQLRDPVPNIISRMVAAGNKSGVGPMAAVAGAIAEQVGLGLLELTDQVIVENGGDIFIRTNTPLTVGIYAGKSPLNLKIGIRVNCGQEPVAVCTSSATVGHSLSLGKADAVCVLADSCSIADAAATSIGNLIQSPADIQAAISMGKRIREIKGLAIIIDKKIGLWGDIEVVPLRGKKG